MLRTGRNRFQAILCVTAAALAAAALAAPAAADDGEEFPAAEAIAGVGPATAAAAVEDAVEAAAAAIEHATPGDEPTTDGEPDATLASDSEEDAPEASDPASAAESASDTAGGSSDTAADNTSQQPPAGHTDGSNGMPAGAPSAPTGERTAPAINVNVSVRIGSAGDNGAVTQENATAGGTPTRPDTTAKPVERPTAPSSSPAGAESAETWYWQWDCVSMPTIPVVSPTDSWANSIPRNWTWIWNCGDNEGQYQDEASQYQQINANVSIRVSSPGDNGPVSQKNIAITATVSSGSSSAAPPLTGWPPTTGPITIPVTIPSVSVEIAVPTDFPALPDVLSGVPAAEAGTVDLAVDVAVASDLTPGVLGRLPGEVSASVPFGHQAGLPRTGRWAGVAATLWTPKASGVAGTPMSIRHVARPAGAENPKGSSARPARWAPVDDATAPRAPAPSPAGTSASAAGAGGSPGGGLPIFIALAFLAAVLDLARRVALERATWPPGHRRRIPDTPG